MLSMKSFVVAAGRKLWEQLPFENLNIGNFVTCAESPQTELKEFDMEITLHMQFQGARFPNCDPLCSMTSRFQDIAHFMISP